MATSVSHPVLKSWFWAVRPFSLSASVSPVLVGTAAAASSVGVNWLLFALALTGSIAIQIGTNLADEYADHRRYGGMGKFPAPHKVIQRGALSEGAVLVGMLASFGYGVGAGLYIVSQAGWPILVVGLASVAVAYLYSSGPYPIGNLGLGEAVVFVFMGPVMVMSAYYVQTADVTISAFLVSLPVAFLVTAILHCNNLRDTDEDRMAGKRSIAGWIGPEPSRLLYVAFLASAYVAIVAAVSVGAAGAWMLLGLVPAPWAVLAGRRLFTARQRRDMNMMLVRSAKLHGWTGVMLAAGLALNAVL